ncbi:MAG: hypothetical protein IPM47_14685 [Sphingobacteriales bacterium]|nr:MAG: hypothetical protein IPM47_14685 [Sphingobacteriales bacterium]
MSNPVFSPDGKYKVVFSSFEMRMSHWVDNPIVIKVATNEVVYELGGLYSADTVKWSEDSRFVTMSIREYPGRKKGFTIIFDVQTETSTRIEDE